MAYLTLMGKLPHTLSQTAQRTIGLHLRTGSLFLSIVTLSLAATLSILYFMQINFIAQKGIQINHLQNKINQIKHKNMEIASDIEQIDSLLFTRQVVSEQLHMEEIQSVKYWPSSYHKILAKE